MSTSDLNAALKSFSVLIAAAILLLMKFTSAISLLLLLVFGYLHQLFNTLPTSPTGDFPRADIDLLSSYRVSIYPCHENPIHGLYVNGIYQQILLILSFPPGLLMDENILILSTQVF